MTNNKNSISIFLNQIQNQNWAEKASDTKILLIHREKYIFLCSPLGLCARSLSKPKLIDSSKKFFAKNMYVYNQ